MNIKEFCKKNRRVIKIAGIVTLVVVTNYITYDVAGKNGVVYATRRIAGVLTKEECDDIGNRLVETRGF